MSKSAEQELFENIQDAMPLKPAQAQRFLEEIDVKYDVREPRELVKKLQKLKDDSISAQDRKKTLDNLGVLLDQRV